jgi:endonuclease-3
MATATSSATWKRPPPKRLRTILERLHAEYGRPVGRPHRAPVDELVLTVLSQNTNDRNRDVAYERLRERFDQPEERSRIAGEERSAIADRASTGPGSPPASTARRTFWEAVRNAPVEEVEDAIRPGGLAATKSPRIQSILEALDGDDLERLADEPLDEARAELCELPGVGRKTAACVLLFSFGRHDVPVDTHVHRVGTRLGLFRPGAPLDEAHDEMLRLARREDPFESHVSLIRHGRRLCSARSPRCDECPLRSMCPWARGQGR